MVSSAEAAGIESIANGDEMGDAMEADSPDIRLEISLIETSSRKCIASVNQDSELILADPPRPRIDDQVRYHLRFLHAVCNAQLCTP